MGHRLIRPTLARRVLTGALVAMAAVPGCKPQRGADPGAAVAQKKAATGTTPGSDTVLLSFNQVWVEDIVPYLQKETGKRVTVSEKVRRHQLTLMSDEVMSRQEALRRVLEKLRLDGLRVTETSDAIAIEPGRP